MIMQTKKIQNNDDNNNYNIFFCFLNGDFIYIVVKIFICIYNKKKTVNKIRLKEKYHRKSLQNPINFITL